MIDIETSIMRCSLAKLWITPLTYLLLNFTSEFVNSEPNDSLQLLIIVMKSETPFFSYILSTTTLESLLKSMLALSPTSLQIKGLRLHPCQHRVWELAIRF